LTLRKILEAALHPDSQSVVILSGRLWPSDLEEIVATPEDGSEPRRLRSFHRIDVRPLEFKDLEAAGDDNPFAALDPRVQAELCSLLCGHDYALLLAAAYVDGRSADEIDDLCRRLAAKPPDHRHAAMVRVILKELESADAPESSAGGLEGDEGKDCRGRAGKGRYPLVGYLALFQSPFSKETLQACCELAGFDEDASQELVTQELMRKGLLFKILKGSGHPEGFTIHPMVRDFLAEEPEAFVTSRPPNFAISGFLSKFSGLSPGPRRFRRMTRVFEQLSTLIHDLIDEAPQPAAPAAEAGGDSKAIVLCRDLYGLLRSQADAIGASPRGERCTSYMVRGIVLAQLTKELFPTRELWRFRSHQRAAAYSASAPLYIAELLWLYNDIGTALFSEGLMPDAYAVWEQAYEIAKVIEGPHTPGKLTAEQEVNLCHTFLELGHVSVARGYLERARRICDTLGDAELTARITGYRAFFDHIQGNLSAADKRYGSACSQLDRSDNLRACSFFKTLHALLRLRLADHARAQQLANSARALAEAGGFPDLVVYSQIAEASVLKEKKMFTEARLEVNDALSRARKIGMRGIEAVLLQLLSRLVHAQGDAEGARHHALQSLRLANELGLGLVQTRGLLALGLATLATGDQELGMAYLDIAQQQAENQQYFLRARDIQHEYGLRAERWRPAARRESPGYRHQVP
jgi:tetratricopeptide (TPR) repeat protein